MTTNLGWLFLLTGAVFAVIGWHGLALGRETSGWPSTKGRVLGQRLALTWIASRMGVRPLVLYRYRVEGTAYECDRISYRLDSSMVFSEAERVAYHYPPGSDVVVRYDPRRPERAVLEAGTGAWPGWNLACGVAFILAGAVLLL